MLTRRKRAETLLHWIERNLSKPDERGCRHWLRARTEKGYGVVSVARTKIRRVTRILWEHAHGPIPSDAFICHHCDAPSCCELSHLFAATNAGNMRDCDEKGHRPKGEKHWRARLSEADVRAIRARSAGGETQAAIAAHFGVDQALVSRIVHRKLWAHVS